MVLQQLPIPLLVIAGPTATGKTNAAIQVAQAVGGEIVSADSMQIYHGMDIGTAKPTPEQQGQAAFHLIDIVNPDQEYNVACFQRDARAAISDIHQRHLLPILCGGTGLYVQAVVEHFDFPPGPADKQVRKRLTREAANIGAPAMHQRLTELDPAAAARIESSDLRRIVRRLEVYELTGQPLSGQEHVDDCPPLKYNNVSFVLCCPRPLLHQRIEQRVDQMQAGGWLAEVQRLRAAGYHSGMQSMQAIGYRHLLLYLEQGGELATTLHEIKRDSRQFAKRQITWFRNRMAGEWLYWSTPEEQQQAVKQLIAAGRDLDGGAG